MKKHLAIFSHSAIKQIYSGKKSAEARFSQKKIPPFLEVGVGDLVYIKPPGEEISGRFFVSKVIFIEGLEKEDWDLVKQIYSERLGFMTKKEEAEFYKTHSNAKYATLITIDRVEQFITSPIRIPKKDLRGWVVL